MRGSPGRHPLAVSTEPQSPAAAATPSDGEQLLTLTATEHAFTVAAVDSPLIPADELSPSGSQCGVASPAASPAPPAVNGCCSPRIPADGDFSSSFRILCPNLNVALTGPAMRLSAILPEHNLHDWTY
jgi:hypothetical protein